MLPLAPGRPRTRQRIFQFAISLLMACLPARPANAQSTALEPVELSTARNLLSQNKLAEAEQTLRSYLASHLAEANARYLLAFTLFRENKPGESLAEYTHAAQLQTPTPEELRHVALDYVLMNDYADAEKWLTRVVTAAPNDGESWYDLGRVKATENRFSEAVECFNKALALTPHLVKAENNLGIAYAGLNRLDDAAAAYRLAIAWQQDTAEPSEQPFLNLGTLLVDRGQLTEALPLLRRAQAIAPGDAKIHEQLGRLYLRQDNLAQAQRELEQATVAVPDRAALHFQLGQVYRKEGFAEKAKAEFSRAAALDATHSAPETH